MKEKELEPVEPSLGILQEDLEDDPDWEEGYDYEDEDEDPPYGEAYSVENPDIHIKWITDQCETLSDVALHLRSYADYCEALEKEGWQLCQPVDNSHGFVAWAGEGAPPPLKD